MNKYAAEKIASQYYNAGIQLALQSLGQTKTAMPSHKAMIAMGAPLGLFAGTGQSGKALLSALKSINPTQSFDPAKLQAIMSGAKADVSGYGTSLKNLLHDLKTQSDIGFF